MRNFIFILFISSFLSVCNGQTYKISTDNMSPALKIGDVCKAEEIKDSPIQRFDIVVFRMPQDIMKITGEKGDIKIISRVIGLPGERVEIKKGKTQINDKPLDENFEKTIDAETDFPAIVIPENEYFLLGDNRPQSLDSRYWSKPTIAKKDISGKVSGCKK